MNVYWCALLGNTKQPEKCSFLLSLRRSRRPAIHKNRIFDIYTPPISDISVRRRIGPVPICNESGINPKYSVFHGMHLSVCLYVIANLSALSQECSDLYTNNISPSWSSSPKFRVCAIACAHTLWPILYLITISRSAEIETGSTPHACTGVVLPCRSIRPNARIIRKVCVCVSFCLSVCVCLFVCVFHNHTHISSIYAGRWGERVLHFAN